MIEFIKNLIIKKIPSYSLVEKHDKENDRFIQGVKITSGEFNGVVFTTSDKVSLKPNGESFDLNYEYRVEYAPEGVDVSHEKISSTVGNIIMDIIQKEHNAS